MPPLGHRSRNLSRVSEDCAFIMFFDKSGILEKEARIDTEDLDRVLSVGKWNLVKSGYVRYEGNKEQSPIALHQFVMGIEGKQRVRFKNGNCLDCRKANLVVTGKYNPVAVMPDGIAYLSLFDSKGEVVAKTKIDPDDAERVVSFGRWWITNQGYVSGDGWLPNRVRVKLHRFITNAPEGAIVDHINGDVKDNRKVNLRIVGAFENQQNRQGANKNSTTGIRNVHLHTQTGRYAVVIGHGGKTYSYGLYETIGQAANVAAEKRRELEESNNPS